MTTASKNKRILLVDDDNDILDVMQEALSYEGYEVNGLIGTDNIFPEIIQYRPDIIILDYLLQGINGGELCHQIKINRHTNNIPVIMISAYPRVLNSIGNYGYDAFIAKPFNLNEISDRVNKLINESQRQYSC
jgi:DNA-binding response OmpR family regulator